jgi:membrane associated rhomboid family serine protease
VSEISQTRQNTVNVGASGGLYGLLLAFGMIFPNVMIMMLIPPIPMKAKYFVIVFGAIELFSGLRQNVDDNVAHFAHLGGMLFGIILILLWRKQDRKRNVFHP